MKDVISTLSEKKLISDSHKKLLDSKYSGISSEIFKRMSSVENKNSGKGIKYSPELKSLALTFQFYSTKAYNYVRKIFKNALPSPNHISSWYSKIPAEPGFTKPSFDALSLKVKKAESSGNKILCSLMLDEMSLKKQAEWDGTQYRGFVDIGDGMSDEKSPLAENALVFMAVAVNGSFKVPIGYFPIVSLTGKEKANLVQIAIKKLEEIGVNVVSLICDGPPSHFSMMRELGASLKVQNMQTFFMNPHDPNRKVHVFLDVCHMLKLVRNNFKKVMVMYDGKGRRISWEFIEELAKVQEDEGLRSGLKWN